jgi:hypothetical protein
MEGAAGGGDAGFFTWGANDPICTPNYRLREGPHPQVAEDGDQR